MFTYLRPIALLSLSSGSYKYLKESGLLKSSNSDLLTKGVVQKGNFIAVKCHSRTYSAQALAALGAGVIIWFLLDTLTEYDENGVLRFRL